MGNWTLDPTHCLCRQQIKMAFESLRERVSVHGRMSTERSAVTTNAQKHFTAFPEGGGASK